MTAFLMLLAGGTAYCLNIAMKPRYTHLTIAANFSNDGITPPVYTSMSSWGVQIVGGS